MAARRGGFARARKAAGYTQESLAAALHVDRSTVVRWEGGQSEPWPYLWPKLAKLLSVTPVELSRLLAGDEQPAVSPRQQRSTSPDEPEYLLDVLDRTRRLVDHTLTTGLASHTRLDLIEEGVTEHLHTYTRTPPLAVLQRLNPDFLEVQSLAVQRQPAVVQYRLSEATARLSLLSADALMKLGEIERARYWYGTARLAADDTLNIELRASVRAQQAMLPYYYGHVEHAVRLAREAQALVPAIPCHPAALAAAAEARALARLGRADNAEQAMHRAQRLMDALGGQDEDEDIAFEFTEKRLLLYLSGTLTYLGQFSRARRVQEQALARYRADAKVVIDPALIKLDQAVGEAAHGDSDDACQLAMTVLEELPAEHRTRIILTRARDVARAIPSGRQRRPIVGELHELVSSQETASP
jgi:transcriptional regulator with XRE-family HTH domain